MAPALPATSVVAIDDCGANVIVRLAVRQLFVAVAAPAAARRFEARAAILAKLVGRMSGPLGWVGYLSVLNAYEPQRLVEGTGRSWWLLAQYDGILLAVGLGAYALGALLFARRDLPAPL